MFGKNVKPENLDKESLFSQINAIVDKSRDNVNQWVLAAGEKQITLIIEALDKLLPDMLPYAAENFRWRISDTGNESLLYHKEFSFIGVVDLPAMNTESTKGNISVRLIVEEDGKRFMKFEVTGETSFLRGHEQLGGRNGNNDDLCNAIWNRDYPSKYGIYPASFFMNDDRLGIDFMVKLNG